MGDGNHTKPGQLEAGATNAYTATTIEPSVANRLTGVSVMFAQPSHCPAMVTTTTDRTSTVLMLMCNAGCLDKMVGTSCPIQSGPNDDSGQRQF